jgi:hypothetical protein
MDNTQHRRPDYRIWSYDAQRPLGEFENLARARDEVLRTYYTGDGYRQFTTALAPRLDFSRLIDNKDIPSMTIDQVTLVARITPHGTIAACFMSREDQQRYGRWWFD